MIREHGADDGSIWYKKMTPEQREVYDKACAKVRSEIGEGELLSRHIDRVEFEVIGHYFAKGLEKAVDNAAVSG